MACCLLCDLLRNYIYALLTRKDNCFLETAALAVFAVWMLFYILFCDKSFYSIDNVSAPFILFLYFESMLLGALFKKHRGRFGKFNVKKAFFSVLCLVVYFISKTAFSKYDFLLNFQIVNQLVILITLFAVFDLFMSLEDSFKKMPRAVKVCVRHISNITLQIYIVQFVIIGHFEKLAFPLNLAVVTLLILVAASVLYYAEFYIRKLASHKNKH